MLPNLMRIASRSSVYSLLCWLVVAIAPHGLAQTYQGKQLVKAELLAIQTRLSRQAVYRRLVAANGPGLAHLLEIFR